MSFGFESHAQTGAEVFGHNDTKDGNPAGGYAATCEGAPTSELNTMMHYSDHPGHFVIRWQDGPVNCEAGEQPNGAFVEDVLEVCKRRLEFYQDSPFACHENEVAIGDLEHALETLLSRRKDRAERGVQGKNEA